MAQGTVTVNEAKVDAAAVRAEIGKDRLINMYTEMLRIRRFEERAGAMYQQKKLLVSCICTLAKKPWRRGSLII